MTTRVTVMWAGRRRRGAIGALFATGVLAAASGVQAQVPTADSVTGEATQSTGGGPVTFRFDAHSGPSGENPTGTVEQEGQPLPAQVSCLAVSGSRATIGLALPPFAGIPGTLFFVEDNDGAGLDRFAGLGRPLPAAPAVCSASFHDLQGLTSGDITVVDAPPAAGVPGRMVGKGGVSGGATTASYAYVVRCDSATNPGAAFEVRFGAQRFRLTLASAVWCTDDPAVPTPAAGLDTQEGRGTGTLTTGGPGTIEWKFVDGGAGGANDSAQITIRNAAGPAAAVSPGAARRVSKK